MSGVFWSSNASFVGTNSIGIGFIRIRIECSLTSQRSQYDVWLTIRDENQHSHVPQCGIWIRIRDKDLKMYSICMCKFFWHLISRDPTNPWATVYLSNLRCFWYFLFRSKYIGYLFLRLITHGDVSVSKVGNFLVSVMQKSFISHSVSSVIVLAFSREQFFYNFWIVLGTGTIRSPLLNQVAITNGFR